MIRFTHMMVLSAAALLLVAAGPSSEQARLVTVKGDVEIGSGEPPVWRPAQQGDVLSRHDALRTGSNGRVELQLPTGTVRLYPSSLLHLATDPADPGAERVEVKRGTSLFDVLKRGKGETFQVDTHDAVLVVKGTRFSVAVNDVASSMAVFRGLVGVRAIEQSIDSEILVRPGFAVVGQGGAPFELVVNPDKDPWQNWSNKLPAPSAMRDRAPQVPAKAAIDMATRSAMSQVQPMLAKRMEQMRNLPRPELPAAARKGQEPAADSSASDMKKQMKDMSEMRANARAKLVEMMERRGSDPEMMAKMEERLDSVTAPDSEVMEGIQEEYVEAVVDGGTGGGGSTNMEVEFVDGSGAPGPDRIRIYGSGLDEERDESQLQDMMSGGVVNFSPALVTLLANQGMDPLQFAYMLQQMF